MRMAELAERSGESVATIKYYRREGLLPPGEPTAPNQADYGQQHVDRLRLVRVLRDVADLPVAAIRTVLEAVDDPSRPIHEVVGAAHRALDPGQPEPDPEARAMADGVIARAGWQVADDAPARDTLARALAALDVLGVGATEAALDRYVTAADQVAAQEVAVTLDGAEEPSRDVLVTSVVVGTVVFEQVLTAMRRLAQEHHSAVRG